MRVESERFVRDRSMTRWVDENDSCFLPVYAFSVYQWQLGQFHSLLSDVALRLELAVSTRLDGVFGNEWRKILLLSLSVSV